MKITFMGAGSTVFLRNVMNDCMQLLDKGLNIALYDIDADRLKDSEYFMNHLNAATANGAIIKCYCGVENRKAALHSADYVINAIQVGRYKPSTVIDFKYPNRYGLRQTIGDTMGVAGIFRALRTIPIMEDFSRDMQEVCPNALFLNYTNPMAMLSGYMQRYGFKNTVGLCHSVQNCASNLLKPIGMEEYLEGVQTKIAGINHMAWLLEIKDKNGVDLYPMIKSKKLPLFCPDKVRHKLMNEFGYYVTESSEHNAEYHPYFIKKRYPLQIVKYLIPLNEYPRRCRNNIKSWEKDKAKMDETKVLPLSGEYASRIINAIETNTPYEFGGNVLNNQRYITNLPTEACIEIPVIADGKGLTPQFVGALPYQLAGLNSSNVFAQLMAIEAAVTKRRDCIYQACLLDPHTAAELSIDKIKRLCDAMIEAHGDYLPKYH